MAQLGVVCSVALFVSKTTICFLWDSSSSFPKLCLMVERSCCWRRFCRIFGKVLLTLLLKVTSKHSCKNFVRLVGKLIIFTVTVHSLNIIWNHTLFSYIGCLNSAYLLEKSLAQMLYCTRKLEKFSFLLYRWQKLLDFDICYSRFCKP